MAKVPALQGAIRPDQVRRAGTDPSASRRLVVVLLLVGNLVAAASWWYLTRFSPAALDLVMSDAPVRVELPGLKKTQAVRTAPDLGAGSTITSDESRRTALRFGSGATFRLAPHTRLRILGSGPVASNGVEVALDRGRLWLERESSWVPVVVRVGDVRLEPGVGSVEIRNDEGLLTVLGWTGTVWVRDAEGQEVYQVDLNRGGVFASRDWSPIRISGNVDAWAAWNMHTTASDLVSGEMMDMEVAYRLEKPPAFVFESVLPPQPRHVAARDPGGPREEPPPPPAPPEAAPPPPPVAAPGLPQPDYPTGVKGQGGRRSGQPPRPPAADPPAEEASSPEGAAMAATSSPRWQMPDRLSKRGKSLPPSGPMDLTTQVPVVETQADADRIAGNVKRVLERDFNMALDLDFKVVAAQRDDKKVRIEGNVSFIMSMEKRGDAWVARIANNLKADEFAAFAAALYARAWLVDQGLDPGGLEGYGFQRWIAFKYSLAVGNKNQARSIPAQGGRSSVWMDDRYDRGFHILWTIEEKYGERGVFLKVLGENPTQGA